MDRLEAMRVFVRVVEMGSFSAVAKQLNSARSVVTRQVAALEAHLGTKLLARSTRRLTLTSAGTLYLEKCRVILNLVDAAETDVAEDRGTPRGGIRLSLPLVFGIKRLAPLLLDFAEQYPEVELSMDFSDRRAKLVEEGIDLSIRITRRLEPTDIVRKLGNCRLFAVAGPGYLARHGSPGHPADLAKHECLGYRQDSGSQPWTFIVDGQAQDYYVPVRFEASNGEVLAGAAVRGMGITLQPDFVVTEHLADGSLEQILADFATPELGIYALLPSNRHVPYRVRCLIEFLAARLGAASLE